MAEKWIAACINLHFLNSEKKAEPRMGLRLTFQSLFSLEETYAVLGIVLHEFFAGDGCADLAATTDSAEIA